LRTEWLVLFKGVHDSGKVCDLRVELYVFDEIGVGGWLEYFGFLIVVAYEETVKKLVYVSDLLLHVDI
jgi:hypothetical protein